MLNSPKKIIRGVMWTVGPFGASVVLRLASNVIISRLLTPDIFGIMVVISTIRYGVELLTDIGIEQSIVQNKNGEEPRFSNTAWTIQLLRSILLFAVLLAVSWPLASFFDIPASYIQFSGLMIVIVGLQSPARAFLQRRLQFAARNLFELALVAANSIITVGLVYLSPTVWGVLLSNTVATAVATGATFLLPTSKVRFTLDRQFAREIISFGKWIFLSSLVAFLCGHFDRIYLGHVAPLAVLGVFGIARNMADIPGALAGRLGHFLIFPLISSGRDMETHEIRNSLSRIRYALLLAAALAMGFATALSDLFIHLIYDNRYDDAAWMLPILLIGVWFTLLSTIAESVLLGVGKSNWTAVGNGLKLPYFLIALPLAYSYGGILGAIMVFAGSDLARYAGYMVGLSRIKLEFRLQDISATVVFVLALAGFSWLRHHYNLGTAFDAVPWSMITSR